MTKGRGDAASLGVARTPLILQMRSLSWGQGREGIKCHSAKRGAGTGESPYVPSHIPGWKVCVTKGVCGRNTT